jgi:hypothetical protein
MSKNRLYILDRIIIFAFCAAVAFVVNDFYKLTGWGTVVVFFGCGMVSSAIGYKKKEDR